MRVVQVRTAKVKTAAAAKLLAAGRFRVHRLPGAHEASFWPLALDQTLHDALPTCGLRTTRTAS